MSTIRKKIIRLANWFRRSTVFPAHLVDHVGLMVTLTDSTYSVKSTIRNLTGRTLRIKAAASVSDSVGLLSFENLLSLGLWTSEQLFRVRCTGHTLSTDEFVELSPYDEINFEVVEVNKATGVISIPHRFGVSHQPSPTCRLAIKVYGAGKPHFFKIVLSKDNEVGDLMIVRQQASLNETARMLELKLDSVDEVSV